MAEWYYMVRLDIKRRGGPCPILSVAETRHEAIGRAVRFNGLSDRFDSYVEPVRERNLPSLHLRKMRARREV